MVLMWALVVLPLPDAPRWCPQQLQNMLRQSIKRVAPFRSEYLRELLQEIASYQSNKDLRTLINSGETDYTDLHLSSLAQDLRYGFYGDIDVAIIEAAEVTPEGEIVPTSVVGILTTI